MEVQEWSRGKKYRLWSQTLLGLNPDSHTPPATYLAAWASLSSSARCEDCMRQNNWTPSKTSILLLPSLSGLTDNDFFHLTPQYPPNPSAILLCRSPSKLPLPLSKSPKVSRIQYPKQKRKLEITFKNSSLDAFSNWNPLSFLMSLRNNASTTR